MSTPSQETQSSDIAGYVMLVIDELKLLIPQAQISSLELSIAMEIDTSDALTAGYFQFENQSWPVFCFNNNLDVLKSVPEARKVCILLQTETDYFALLCDQALLIKPEVIQLQALPEVMTTNEMPLSALAILDDEIISISSAENLARLLPLHKIRSSAKPAL